MRYLCLNCEERFEHEDGAGKLRCPKCLRVTGLEKLADPKKATAQQRTWLAPAIVAGVIATAIGGWAVWRARGPATVGDEVAMAPLSQDILEAHLRREDVDARPLTRFLVADDALEELGRTGSGDSPEEIAQGVYEAIRARSEAGAFSRWSMGVPRETPLQNASAAWGWLDTDGAHRRLYPLEAAAIMAVALRTHGVPAMIAETFAFPGDHSPPDPSGHFGYYTVAVYDGEPGEGTPHLFDPWGGHETEPEEGDYEVLNDVQAIGAALSLRAIHLLVRESDPERALSVSQDAVSVLARSPSVRSVRGAILLAAGNAQEALEEFRAAAQIRNDAPRRNLMASMYLAQGETSDASREVSAALEAMPEYAAAHGTLAAIHLSSAEPDEALRELREAQRLDPELHILAGLWASYYAGTGDLDRAVEYARSAIEANPGDLQSRLMAARIYRQAARYDDMRREARAVMDATPEARREQMEQLIHQLLGPSALDAPLDEEELTDDELFDEGGDGELTLDGSGFQLGSPTLGRPTGPSSLELGGGDDVEDDAPDGEPAEGPALMLGDRSHFHLGGSGGSSGTGGDGLHLDLGGH